MMYYEINKKRTATHYNGDYGLAIADRCYVLWTADRIKAAFNHGNGTMKDFKRYMADNKMFNVFIKAK